jgi:hypothetical protein
LPSPWCLPRPPAGCGRLPALDPISVIFLGHRILYGTTAVYSLGYLHGAHRRADLARYSRLFWVGLNLFAW